MEMRRVLGPVGWGWGWGWGWSTIACLSKEDDAVGESLGRFGGDWEAVSVGLSGLMIAMCDRAPYAED